VERETTSAVTTRRAFLAALGAMAILGAGASAETSPPRRIELSGVDNLYQVAPGFYRSAQPTKLGFARLASDLQIRTVVNLRELHDDAPLAAGLPIELRRIGINTWHIGDDNGEKVVRALSAIRQGRDKGPVLVHCQHGSDRTGAIVAFYRILVENWDKERAIAEMMTGPFHFHAIWGNIPGYIRSADIADLKRRVEAASAL